MVELEIINLVVVIIASVMGIIISFSISNMSSAYRSLLPLLSTKSKDKQTIKKWAEVIKEYLERERKWILAGLVIILFLIVSYFINQYFLYGMLASSFVWIFSYVINTYKLQIKELDKIIDKAS